VPELPEVETIRRGLERVLPGRRIVQAHLKRPDICRGPGDHRCRAWDLLLGATFDALQRCGKQLALVGTDGRVLVVQLGMTGQLRIITNQTKRPRDHVHAEWLLDDGSRLVFRDPRRFGRLTALASTAALRERWSQLGPDALAVTGRQLAAALRESRRAIKAGLLDQRAVAGVGNIYADESLFRARIRPDRLCTTLAGRDYSRLAAAIRQTLELAVWAGGSTLRDYTMATGEPGKAQQGHLVYGRGGEACPKCRGPLAATRLAQRATVFCPACQR
jgi:formamidopyrimidine-DNA glycosylase